MNKLFAVVAVLLAVQISSARVVRDAPASLALGDLAKQAEDAIGTLHSKFLEIVGVKNDNEFIKLLENQGRSYASKIQSYAKLLGDEAKANAGKADKVFQGLQTRLTQTVDELKSKNPEIFANVEKFQGHLKAVLKDTEQFNAKLKEEGKVISSNVEEVLKQIYDSTVQTAQKVANEIESNLKQKKTK
ncbi:unnamed protein product [Hermetia illucens]|uniref:Apolipophorin-III n=1 Tax=Hermetia illucens TaxID=343691 RepID=A0A7R8URT0_HERIL|nr:uncharacterized protein LOC119652406 [Hermetia illucens]CAD7085848.1 unnamed protein product [Hermetia illucens]